MEYKAEDYIDFIESGRRDKISPDGLELIASRFRELEQIRTSKLDILTYVNFMWLWIFFYNPKLNTITFLNVHEL